MRLENNINQMEGEDSTSWQIRLLLGKAQGFYEDMSWDDIADILNAPVRGSHLADRAKGMKILEQYLNNQNDDIDLKTMKTSQMIENKRNALQEQKIQLSDVKTRFNRVVREHSRLEYVAKKLADNISTWVDSQKFNIEPKYGSINKLSDKEAILLLSDWHYGQCSANNANEFNTAIAEQRIQELVNQVIEYSKYFNPSKLHIILLGDMMNGLIHVTSRIQSTDNVCDQFKGVTLKLIDLIRTMRDYFPQVNVYGVRGNHDRMIPNLKEHVVSESFFDIIPFTLKLAFQSIKGINVIDNDKDAEIVTAKICDKNIVAVHGDKDNPRKAVDNLTGMFKTCPDFIFMGHFHHREEFERFNSRVIVNGSFCGVDEFATNQRLISYPSQTLLILDKDDFFCKFDINFKSGVKYNNIKNGFKEY